jgi:hypothetical protein
MTEIKDIPKLILSLQERVLFLEALVPGVDLWLSPASAAKILPFNRDQIVQKIHEAEKAHVQGKKSPLVHGTHYFNSTPDGDRPTWKVHRVEFTKVVLKQP